MPTLNPTPGEVREQGPREVHPFRFVDHVTDSGVSNFGPVVEKVNEPSPVVTVPVAVAPTEPNEPAQPVVEESEVPNPERVLEETAAPEAQEAEAEEAKQAEQASQPVPVDPEIV